jgi:hypothetical protein
MAGLFLSNIKFNNQLFYMIDILFLYVCIIYISKLNNLSLSALLMYLA